MNEFAEEKKDVGMAEIWRQNYADAKDEIRNLKLRISELEAEKEMLLSQILKSKQIMFHAGMFDRPPATGGDPQRAEFSPYHTSSFLSSEN